MNLIQEMHERGIKIPETAETEEQQIEALLAAYDEMRAQRDSANATVKQCVPLAHKLFWIANIFPARSGERCASEYAKDTLRQSGLHTVAEQGEFLTSLNAVASEKAAHELPSNADRLAALLDQCYPLVYRFAWAAHVWNDHNFPRPVLSYICETAERHGVNDIKACNALLENMSRALLAQGYTTNEEKENGR